MHKVPIDTHLNKALQTLTEVFPALSQTKKSLILPPSIKMLNDVLETLKDPKQNKLLNLAKAYSEGKVPFSKDALRKEFEGITKPLLLVMQYKIEKSTAQAILDCANNKEDSFRLTFDEAKKLSLLTDAQVDTIKIYLQQGVSLTSLFEEAPVNFRLDKAETTQALKEIPQTKIFKSPIQAVEKTQVYEKVPGLETMARKNLATVWVDGGPLIKEDIVNDALTPGESNIDDFLKGDSVSESRASGMDLYAETLQPNEDKGVDESLLGVLEGNSGSIVRADTKINDALIPATQISSNLQGSVPKTVISAISPVNTSSEKESPESTMAHAIYTSQQLEDIHNALDNDVRGGLPSHELESKNEGSPVVNARDYIAPKNEPEVQSYETALQPFFSKHAESYKDWKPEDHLNILPRFTIEIDTTKEVESGNRNASRTFEPKAIEKDFFNRIPGISGLFKDNDSKANLPESPEVTFELIENTPFTFEHDEHEFSIEFD